jgi:hypothetical protein
MVDQARAARPTVGAQAESKPEPSGADWTAPVDTARASEPAAEQGPSRFAADQPVLARLADVLNAEGPAGLYRDKKLLRALAALSVDDPPAYALARVALRQADVKMRDFERAIKRLVIEEIKERPPALSRGETGGFFEDGGCICRTKLTPDGPVTVQLCNFTAKITDETTRDDGVECERRLGVAGRLYDGRQLPRVEIPADQFSGLGWVVPSFGSDAIVWPGEARALPPAIQALSQEGKTCRTVYTHTGWRKIGDDWYFLHAGGAIGPKGLAIHVEVSLPDPLAGFRLPNPPAGPALADAIRASLGMLRLGPDRATFPLLAAVYRAVLGYTDFALHLAGPTGCFKSEAAALAQQHYGAGLDARHLPASWSSTGNALEGLAFAAKDVLLVVDDFCPTGSAADVQRYHKDADRLLRGQGNRAGRQRMRADASLRPAKPPRGLTLSTGEDTPRGQSLRARFLGLDISPGDFGPQPPNPNPTLSACQRDAASGLYALAMAGYVHWLAPQMDAIRGRLQAEQAELRDMASGDGQHARTPGIIAGLALGLRYLLDFALTAGAISEVERAELWRRGWTALTEAAAAQAAGIAAAEPAGLFLRLLSAAVASGSAHIANQKGEEPPEPQRWGWRRDGTDLLHKPQGVRAGWLADGEVYLEPEASFAAVQRMARDQNETFAITAHTLRRRLKEKGLLATTDAARGKLTVRKMLQGVRRDVLHIAKIGAPGAPQTGPTDSEDEGGGEKGPEPWAGLWAGNGQVNDPAAHKMATPGTPGQPPAANGSEMGRLGRSDTGEEAGAGEKNSGQQAADWGDWQ